MLKLLKQPPKKNPLHSFLYNYLNTSVKCFVKPRPAQALYILIAFWDFLVEIKGDKVMILNHGLVLENLYMKSMLKLLKQPKNKNPLTITRSFVYNYLNTFVKSFVKPYPIQVLITF